MTHNGGGSREQNGYLRDISCLGNKNSQNPLASVNKKYCYPHPSPKLAKGIAGTHITITHLPNILTFEQTPSNIGGRGRTQ
ncbi:unnamed protein product, partial [marine sediment metagenome]